MVVARLQQPCCKVVIFLWEAKHLLWLNTSVTVNPTPSLSIQVCQVPVNFLLCNPVPALGGAHNDIHTLYQLSHWSILKTILKNLCSVEEHAGIIMQQKVLQ